MPSDARAGALIDAWQLVSGSEASNFRLVDVPDPPERESRRRLRRAGVVFLIWLIIAVGLIAWGILKNAHG
jgi:hypothetical protein